MKVNKGNYSLINLSNVTGLPNFTFWDSAPLLAMVGGTGQANIYLSDIKIHGRTYTGTITWWLWDDYGVSETDCIGGPLRKIFPIDNALKSQWILQYNRGYKPLVNGFKFTTTVKGEF